MKTWEEIKKQYTRKDSIERYAPPAVKSTKIFKKKEQSYNLDWEFAKYIWPRLIWFKERTPGVPGGLEEKEWKEILDKMINAFGLAAQGAWNLDEEDFDDVKEGMELFIDWYFALWW